MSLFANYRDTSGNDEQHPALTNLLIRPADLSDMTEPGAIEAAREGGETDEYILRLEESITSWGAGIDGIILVAEHAGRLIGHAKGKPVLTLHGGPGIGDHGDNKRMFEMFYDDAAQRRGRITSAQQPAFFLKQIVFYLAFHEKGVYIAFISTRQR